MVVRELLTKLGFEADQSKIDKFENSVGNLTKGLALLVTGATAAATAAFGFASSTARQSEEIERSAKLASTGVEEFQRLAYASESFGIQQDKLADILKDTNDKIGDFFQTGAGPLADFFEFIAPKIGVTAEQFKNLSGSDALQLYVSSLEKANLSQAEMTFYMEAIASDSTLLLPLLEKNGEAYKTLAKEAEEYGYVLSKETIEQNRKLRLELWSLSKMMDSLYTNIGNRFIPLFSDLIKRFKEFIKENRELIQSKLSEFFEGAIWVVKQFISVLGTLIGWINKVAQSLGGWTNALKTLGVVIGVVMSLKFIGYLLSLYKALKAVGWTVALGTALGWGMIALVIALSVAIVLLIEDIYNWAVGNESVIGDLLAMWAEFVTKFKGYLSEGVEYIKTKFGEISTAISNSFNTAIESVKGYFKGLFDDVLVFVDKIIGVFTSLKDKVSNIFGGVKDSIKSGLKAVLPESVATSIGLNSENIGANNTNEYNTNNTNEYVNNNSENNTNLTEQQKQEIYNKINLDDSLFNSLNPQSETITPTTQGVLGANGNSSSNVINDNKNINITVPAGTTTEQVEAIKNEINKTMSQQYTDAALHLEGY